MQSDQLSDNARALIRGFPFAGEDAHDRPLSLLQPFSSTLCKIPNVLQEFETLNSQPGVDFDADREDVVFDFKSRPRMTNTAPFDTGAFFNTFLQSQLSEIRGSASVPEVTSPDMMDLLRTTPASVKGKGKERLIDESSDLDLDIDSEVQSTVTSSAVKSSTTYTPKQLIVVADHSAPLPLVDQLQELLQDIFRSEDEQDAFSQSSKHSRFNERGFLKASTLMQFIKVISQISKAGQASRLMDESFDESGQLDRILRLLRKSVQAGYETQSISTERLKACRDILHEDLATSKKKSTPKKKGPKKIPSKPALKKASSKDSLSLRRSSRSRSGSVSMTEEDDEDDDASDDFEDEVETPTKKRKLNRTPSRSSMSASKASTASSNGLADANGEGWNSEELNKFEQDLEVVYDALLAIQATFNLLSACKLPKRLYSEDFVTLCFRTLKDRLLDTAFPLTECVAKYQAGLLSPLSAAIAHPSTLATIHQLLNGLPAVLSKCTALIKVEEMSEAIIILAVYIAIGPFFIAGNTVESRAKSSTTVSSLRSLRLASLNLLRSLYARYPNQRGWITDETLSMLSQVPDLRQKHFKLRNGKAIHTVSALLLHLIQTSAHGIRSNLRDALWKLDDTVGDVGKTDMEELTETKCSICRQHVNLAIESAGQTSTNIIAFLFSKSLTNPKAGDSNYKQLLETLVADTLSVFDLPEWPAAGFLLSVCLRKVFDVLAVTKVSADATAAKSASLDIMGNVGAALTAKGHEMRQNEVKTPLNLAQALSSNKRAESKTLIVLTQLYQLVISSLAIQKDEDGTFQSASDFFAAKWAFDIMTETRKNNETFTSSFSQADGTNFGHDHSLNDAMLSIWHDSQPSKVEPAEIAYEVISNRLWWHQSQKELFEKLFSRLLQVLNSSDGAVQRSKALKCLSQMVSEDADIFARDDVRIAIESRLRDAQSSVRDAALDLLGEYVVQRADLAIRYLPKICERSTDTGLNVRKRVIKMLKRIYPTLNDLEDQSLIIRTLLWRIKDEDVNVKDLAVSALDELLFVVPRLPAGAKISGKDSFHELSGQILMKLSVDVSQRPLPIDDCIKLVASKRMDNPKLTQELATALFTVAAKTITTLTEDGDADAATRLACAKILDILVSARPSIISQSHFELLLPYLHSSDSAEDRSIRDLLLRIFRHSLPTLPPAAHLTTEKLQLELTQLLNKIPPSQATLQELVACLCEVIKGHTKSYAKLCGIFKAIDKALTDQLRLLKRLSDESCSTQTQCAEDRQETAIHQTRLPDLERKCAALIAVFALLTQHSDFDAIRSNVEESVDAINSLTATSVSDTAFNKLVVLYSQKPFRRLRLPILSALGCLYKGFPTLMMRQESTDLIDAIFEDIQNVEMRSRLLVVIQDFLTSQASKAAQALASKAKTPTKKGIPIQLKDKVMTEEIDIEELIGNTDGFADSGVSSAIVQRYLGHVLQEAVGSNPTNRKAALEIISFTVKLGLAHPVQCLPTIVSLETSLDSIISKKAIVLHSSLQTKHSALVSSRFLECARAAFKYTQSLSQHKSDPRGCRMSDRSALLAPWYGLLKEKRPIRLDFVKTLVKSLAVDPSQVCTAEDVAIARFISDNVAHLDYKTQEEIFTVLKGLDRILGEGAMQTVHLIHEQVDKDTMVLDEQKTKIEGVPLQSLIYSSLKLKLSMLLRDHLKLTYNLSDAKCAKFVEGKKTALGDRAPARPDLFPMFDLGSDAVLYGDFIQETFTEDQLQSLAQSFCVTVESDTSVLTRQASDESEPED